MTSKSIFKPFTPNKVVTPREVPMFEQFYALTVEYVYFAVFLSVIFNTVGDFLFANGSLKSLTKLD